MIELTLEQRHAVSQEESPTVIDPDTNAEYVLVRKDQFDRIKGLMYDDCELNAERLRQILANSYKANGWDEPLMDDYDHYDEKRKCS